MRYTPTQFEAQARQAGFTEPAPLTRPFVSTSSGQHDALGCRALRDPENDETPVSTADRGLSWDTPKGCVDQPFDIIEALVHEFQITCARERARRFAPFAGEISKLLVMHKGCAVYAWPFGCQARNAY